MSDIFTVGTRPGAVDSAMEFFDKTSGQRVFAIGGGLYLPQYKKVVVTATQMIALGGSPVAPVTILSAPGAGYANFILSAVIAMTFNANAYANGSSITFTQNGITVFSTTAALINGVTTGTALIRPAFPNVGTSASEGAFNAPLLMNATSAFTAGDSPVNVHVWYATLLVP